MVCYSVAQCNGARVVLSFVAVLVELLLLLPAVLIPATLH